MTRQATILVVDDTVESLQVLAEILESEGYGVRPANSGELALASIAAQPPDLILLDIRMPGLDGFEVCRRLKAEEATRKIPVIFQSAATDLADRLEGFRLGAVDYISKPFQMEELLARVRTQLELAQLRGGLEKLVKERTRQLEAEIAERKRDEEKIRRLNERFSLATRAAHLGVWDWDLQKSELVWDERMYRLYGLKQEDFSGAYEAWLQGLHPDDRDFSDEISQRARRGEQEYDTEFRVVWPDGSIHWLKAFGHVVRDAEGQPVRMTGVNFDITARKLMEDALFFLAQRSWQAGTENFFNATAQFLAEKLDMDYVLIVKMAENPDTAETVALSAKGEILPNIRYALEGTPCQNVMGQQLCAYAQGVQQRFPEDRLLVEMGVESYVGIPLWDASSRPIGLIALMGSKPLSDAAPATQLMQLVATRTAAELERERSDQLLRTREHEFRTLAENLPDNIVRYDREGRSVYVNPALEKTLGVEAGHILGTRIRELNPDGGYETYAQAVDAALNSGVDSEIELVLPVPSEKPIIHQIRTIAERDEQGEVTGVLAIGFDITNLKQAEEEIRELNQELEQRVAERTAQLQAANQELEKTNRLFVGRELRMVELKEQLRELEAKLSL